MARPKGAPRSTTKHDTHLPSITAKIDKLVNYEDNNLKAFASVTIGGAFTIHGLKVMDSQNGLFVSMPSTKYEKNGKTQYDNPVLEEQLLKLADRLSRTGGKKQYGYLKADVKAFVDSIVDNLAGDERIAALYDLW